MQVVNWLLVLATLTSFVVDIVAIVKGKKVQGVIFLVLFAGLATGLAFEVRHAAAVEAENRVLTNSQARAQRLVDSWNNHSEGFDPEFLSEGEAQGVAVAAADLMEDVRACRPGAAEAARERVADARLRAEQYPGTDLDEVFARGDIWREAAAGAFEQVEAMAEVPPKC